ncbi:unknown [Bacteroides sp. CAG:1076]|jgi:hypothetical protein|nr:unknown [Bacteroides sp. CAG:1076]
MVLKSKVGSYQLHKENKNVQNKEIFPYFIFAINSFFSLFLFYKNLECQKYFSFIGR